MLTTIFILASTLWRLALGMVAALGLIPHAFPAAAAARASTTISAAPGQPMGSTTTDYRLEPNDLITVVVLNHPELSGDILIPEGGLVIFPQVGPVRVNGMTLLSLSQFLEKELAKTLIKPNVAVILKTPRVLQVAVMGDVQRPGPVPLTPGVTLADAVSAAGGLNPDIKAADCSVTILGRGDRHLSEPLDRVLAGDPSANVLLQDGDSVNIDSGQFAVYVFGQVNTPGLQRLSKGAGVLEAIAGAGGSTESAAIGRVTLTHLNGDQEVLNLTPSILRGEKTSLPSLRQGDLVSVPMTTDQYAIMGYVSAPGVFPIPAGQEVTLAEAFSNAKGHDQLRQARLSRVVISHKTKGPKPDYQVYDFGKFLRGGDPTQNPVIRPGDVIYVPQTNQIALRDILAAVASFSLFYFDVAKQ